MRIRPMVIPPYSMICHYALPSNRSSWVSAWIFFSFLIWMFPSAMIPIWIIQCLKVFFKSSFIKDRVRQECAFCWFERDFPLQKESPESLGAAGLLAEWVGFEPTGERIARWISSPCRYDLFGTTPYFVLLYNSSIPGRICQFSFVQNRRIFANLAAEFWRQSGRRRRGAVAPGTRVW